MARDDEWHRVVPQGGAYRAHRLRPADLSGDPAVGPDLPARDLEGLHPDRLLELGVAAKVERHGRPAVALETAPDRPLKADRERAGDGATAGAHLVGARERRRVAGEVGGRHATPVPRHEHVAERGGDGREGIDQPDLDEHVVGKLGGCHGPERERPGAVVIDGGHAVSSWRSCWVRVWRRMARPRWTWALTVPTGRSRAAAMSSYERSS